ncbi:MAG: ABC transporter permease [Pontibacterium sp.]
MLKLEARATPSTLMAYASPFLAAVLTLFSGALLFSLLGKDPWASLYTLLIVPISDVYGLAELCVKAGPILLCAMGLALVYRAQVWNIGAEGQLLMGGVIASWAALSLIDSEGFWVLPVVLVCGMLGGGLWAALAAWLKTRFNANEILTTIMLNYIALNILLYAVHGPLKDPDGFNFPESALFSDSATLPTLIDGTRIHLGIGLALLAVAVVWVLISRTLFGFQVKVMGLDVRAANYAGFSQKKLVWLTLIISGALAGLAGAAEVSGPIGQLIPQISPGYGYSAIIVAFLGRLNPIGILFATFLMALIYMGGEMAQIELGLPVALTGVFQGMLLFYLLACDVLIHFRIKRRAPQLAANG